MATFSGSPNVSSVLPWLFSAAPLGSQSLTNLATPYVSTNSNASATVPVSPLQWLPNVSSLPLSLSDSLALAASLASKAGDKETAGSRAEPLDLSVKAEASPTDKRAKEQQTQLQLAALSSLIPYWNALMQQSQLAQSHSSPALVSHTNGNSSLDVSAVLNSVARPANCDSASEKVSTKESIEVLPELLKLLERSNGRNGVQPKVFSPAQSADTTGNSSTLFGRGCKFDAFCQQLSQTQASPGARHASASASVTTDMQIPLRSSSDSHDDDAKYTDYSCTCGKRYSTVYHLARHLCESGHKPVNNRDEGNDIVKLVRGQDMWLNNETEQTRQILRCMQCKMSCANLTELILHMVTTKHFAEIVYGSSSIAERYKLNECIFNDATSTNDVDNEAEVTNAPLLPTMVNDLDAIGKDARKRRNEASEPNSTDVALDNIDVIGDNMTDRCESEPPKDNDAARQKRMPDDESAADESECCLSAKRRRVSTSEDAPDQSTAARAQLAVILEKTPSPSPCNASALHSLSKFCENMRFEPASLTATRCHTPLSTANTGYHFLFVGDSTEQTSSARKDNEQSDMHVLVPNESTDSDKQSSSPLRSLEKFVRKSSSAAHSTDVRNSDVKVTSSMPTCCTDEPTSTTTEYLLSTTTNTTTNGLTEASKASSIAQYAAMRGKLQSKVKVDKSKSKRSSPNELHEARANANSHTSIPILKKCVCEYCHKRFANKGQVRLHLSKNKCAVLLACFGHQRLQKMSASTLLSGNRAMVLNSLLYNASLQNGANAGSANANGNANRSNADGKEDADAARTSCANASTDFADRFAKYYEIARTLTGNYNSSS